MSAEDPTSRLLEEAGLRPEPETEEQRMSMEEDEEAGRIHLVAYRMMADSAERASDRRQAANNFFIAVNVALAGGYAFMVRENHLALIWPAAILGASICGLWCATLWYYRALNRAKFKLLEEFEKQHHVRGYQREWELFAASNPFGFVGRRLGLSLSMIELLIAMFGIAAHLYAPFLFQGMKLAAPLPRPACYQIVPVAPDAAAAAASALKSTTWYCVAPGEKAPAAAE